MKELNENQKYQLAFNRFQKFGPVKMRLIESYYSNIKEAFYSSSIMLESAGLNSDLVYKFIKWRKTFNLESELDELQKENIEIITWHDQEYPALLLEIHSPPPILYYRGNVALLSHGLNRLAIVGSREHSAYANKIISHLIAPLCKKGIIIVSGLAHGVDTLAHQETLISRGKTIAVLGCGLKESIVYPYSNRELAKNIIKNSGLIISEFPPSIGPLAQNFPQRNRIIAGLCKATLVIESKTKSGALITAYQALEQNREVLAVPGNIFSDFSEGPNNLIKRGAKTILKADDVLEVFNLNDTVLKKKSKQNKKYNNQAELLLENEAENTIYSLIKISSERAEKITSDEICEFSKLDTATINSTLSILEIKDLIKNDFGNYSLM